MNAPSPKHILEDIFRAGLAEVKPDGAVRNHVSISGDMLHVEDTSYDLTKYRRIFLVGAGKGAAPMAAALEEILGDRISGGAVIVKHGHGLPLKKIRVFEAGHPVPDNAGLAASQSLLDTLQGCTGDDLVLCVITGGASALFTCPALPLTLEDKQETTRVLLECGAEIAEINTIRKHLSQTKGGRLAAATYPATLVTLLISDVIGDDPATIGSGPTTPDQTTFIDCLEILEKYRIAKHLPPAALTFIQQGVEGKVPETPGPGDAVFEKTASHVIATNRDALQAATDRATELGFACKILTNHMDGEAQSAAGSLTTQATQIASERKPEDPPVCLLAGGETTVTIKGNGKGGRNQELALAAAIALQGHPGITVLSAGTDGTDGPTDAAGAFASAETLKRAEALHLDAMDYLLQNDSYHFFQQTDDLLVTGPTLTNVMDLVLILIY